MRCIARGPSSELRDKCDCADEEHSLETRATSFAATMNMSLCDTSRIGMPMIMEAGACRREEQQKKNAFLLFLLELDRGHWQRRGQKA